MSDDINELIAQARRDREAAAEQWAKRRAMLGWAAAHRLVSSSGRVTGLGWVTQGKGRNTTLRGPRGGMPELLPRPAFAWDHVSHWRQQDTDTRVVVSQPYDIRPPAAEQVVSYGGHEYRLCWHEPSWYGFGTTLIVILAAGEQQRFPYDGALADPEQISTLWRVNYRGRSDTMPHPPASLDIYLARLLRSKRGLDGNESMREAERLLGLASAG